MASCIIVSHSELEDEETQLNVPQIVKEEEVIKARHSELD
jgi:hypothetical protein